MERLNHVYLGGKALRTPAYFPSISSIKTNISPLGYTEFLSAVGRSHFLLSAYDIATYGSSLEFTEVITSVLQKQALILLDSGNYESYWLRDNQWQAERFRRVLSDCLWPAAFSFDVRSSAADSPDSKVEQILESWTKDQSAQPSSSIIPIVHGEPLEVPPLCELLIDRANPICIAVAERDLGNGIIERLRSVKRIRRALSRSASYVPLHLLGTGNPISILLYTAAGADMYDGLEWCQTAVDPVTCSLLHFHQRDLLDKTIVADTGEYVTTTLLHNLSFYDTWMREIQSALGSDSLSQLIERTLSSRAVGPVLRVLQSE